MTPCIAARKSCKALLITPRPSSYFQECKQWCLQRALGCGGHPQCLRWGWRYWASFLTSATVSAPPVFPAASPPCFSEDASHKSKVSDFHDSSQAEFPQGTPKVSSCAPGSFSGGLYKASKSSENKLLFQK